MERMCDEKVLLLEIIVYKLKKSINIRTRDSEERFYL